MGHNKTQIIIIKSHNNLFSDHRHSRHSRLESTESGTVSFFNNYKHGYSMYYYRSLCMAYND